MKRYIKYAMVIGAFLISSCTSNYLEINASEYDITEEEMKRDSYYAGSVLSALESTVISLDINTTQFTEALLGSTMGGYYATTGGFKNTIENYNPTDDWSRVLMKSDQVIPRLFSYLSALKTSSQDPILRSIANVIKVATMHRVTDTYGPIFYTEIGGGQLQVPYDSQEDVYAAMFTELDEAIDVLTANLDAPILGSLARAEQVYGASPERWCRYANSLKLRLAMRIVYADPVKAKQMAEEAAAHPIGTITSNVDNPKVTTFGVDGNPLYVSTRYNQPSGSVTGGDSHVAADITCYMNGYNDPRREKYFIPSEWSQQSYFGEDWNASWADMVYLGKHRATASWDINIGRHYSGINLSAGSPLYWMYAAEVAFLKAEAAGVFGFEMGGTAKSFYEEGIRLSFDQWGASGYEAYIADATSTPTNYIDPAELDSHNDPLSSITVAWNESATTLQKQERIITQKWIANFNLGHEAWCDYRRTGYPRLMPAAAGGNLGSSDVADPVLGARRMKYPQAEYVDNAANVQSAVANLLGGPDLMRTPIWWDCNPRIWN